MSVATADALVVGPVETSSAVQGTLLLESLVNLSTAIREEDWLDVGLCAVSTVLDAAAAAMDPIGSLIAAGLGWVMEHVEPLKGWLEDLTGDAGAVLGFAGTWDNIAAELTTAGDDYARVLHADLDGMSGDGVAAYVLFAEARIAELRGLSESSSAVAGALRTASTIVQVVHDLVRDALAELVGAAISWALQAALSLGTATPWVVSQVATRVASLATRVGTKVTALVNSLEALRGLVRGLDEALAGLAAGMRRPSATADVTRPLDDVPTGASYRPRPRDLTRSWMWADDMYELLRADGSLAARIAGHYPGLDPDEVALAVRHALHDEHWLGGGLYGDPYRGQFAAAPDNAEAWLRLQAGEATEADFVLLRHEALEASYEHANPDALYSEAHLYANETYNWEALVPGGDG